MGITTILYAVGAMVLIFLVTGLVKSVNAPKTEAEKTAQEQEATKQKEVQKEEQAQRQDHREKVIDKRLTWREKVMQWRRGGRRGQQEDNQVKPPSAEVLPK